MIIECHFRASGWWSGACAAVPLAEATVDPNDVDALGLVVHAKGFKLLKTHRTNSLGGMHSAIAGMRSNATSPFSRKGVHGAERYSTARARGSSSSSGSDALQLRERKVIFEATNFIHKV